MLVAVDFGNSAAAVRIGTRVNLDHICGGGAGGVGEGATPKPELNVRNGNGKRNEKNAHSCIQYFTYVPPYTDILYVEKTSINNEIQGPEYSVGYK